MKVSTVTEDSQANLKAQEWGKRFRWIVETYEKGNRSALARKIGVSPQGAADLCTGKSVPGGDTLQATLQAYPRLSAEWLVLDKKPRERVPVEPAVATLDEIQELLLQLKRQQEGEK